MVEGGHSWALSVLCLECSWSLVVLSHIGEQTSERKMAHVMHEAERAFLQGSLLGLDHRGF